MRELQVLGNGHLRLDSAGWRRRSWGAAAFGFKAAGFDFSFLRP
jgi:hypothetical protein